jgi:hypothetical protein
MMKLVLDVWLWKLACHIEGRTEDKRDRKWCAEADSGELERQGNRGLEEIT